MTDGFYDVAPEDATEVAESVESADSAVLAELTPADLGLELSAVPDEAQRQLLAALLAARQESGEYLESMQRIAAEFENFRKRVDRDRSDLVTRATQRMIGDMLPTLDNFDAALAYEPQTPSEDKILDGMRSTRAQLRDLLQALRLE